MLMEERRNNRLNYYGLRIKKQIQSEIRNDYNSDITGLIFTIYKKRMPWSIPDILNYGLKITD